MKHLSGAPLLGRLLALLTYIGLITEMAGKAFQGPGTNALTYYEPSFYDIGT